MKVKFIKGPFAQKVKKEAQRIILKKAMEAYTSVPQKDGVCDREVMETPKKTRQERKDHDDNTND